jgi:hypothetical protein
MCLTLEQNACYQDALGGIRAHKAAKVFWMTFDRLAENKLRFRRASRAEGQARQVLLF